MAVKRVLLSLIIFLLSYTISCAGELFDQQAEESFREGVQAHRAGNFPEAGACYQKAHMLNPNNAEMAKHIMNNHAIIVAETGNLKEAEAMFKELINRYPDYKPAAINLGFIYDKRRSHVESLEYWVEVLELQKLKPTDYLIDEGPVPEPEPKLIPLHRYKFDVD